MARFLEAYKEAATHEAASSATKRRCMGSSRRLEERRRLTALNTMYAG